MRLIGTRWVSFLLVGLVAQAACGGTGEDAADSPATAETAETALPEGHPDISGMDVEAAPALTRITFACADGQGFELALLEGTETAQLTLDGEMYVLAMQPVASGLEYSDGKVTVRGKGMEAFVERDGESIRSDCKASGHPTSATEE